MGDGRIRQLAVMFSAITGVTFEKSKEIILQTKTGKAVKENNMAVMYEQQTENLYEVAEELREQTKYAWMAEALSVENIVLAMKEFKNNKKNNKIPYIQKKPELKSKNNTALLSKRRTILQVKQQNQMNERKIKHVNNATR